MCEIGYTRSGPLSPVSPLVRQHFQMASSLHHWTDLSQNSYIAPMGWGNEILFVKFWSYDKDGRRAHI